jgi:hypothetical protein
MAKHLPITAGVRCKDLFDLFPDELLEHIADQTRVDFGVSKLTGKLIFKILLYSIITEPQLSTRALAANFNGSTFQVLAGIEATTTKHNSISHRLQNMDLTFMEKIYQYAYSQFEAYYADKPPKEFVLKRYDSTMIALAAKLFDGIKVGPSKAKRHLKLTTEFIGEGLIRIEPFCTQSFLSEETALPAQMKTRKRSDYEVLIFDRGIKSRQTFKELASTPFLADDPLAAGSTAFITRVNPDVRYDVIKTLSDSSSELKLDCLVRLYQSGAHQVDQDFRLIVLAGNQEPIYLVTNLMEIEADQVGQLYRRRWDIEVLFRFMKQELHLNHLLGYSANTIQVVLYMTMIVAMMVLIYKKSNQIKGYRNALHYFRNELENDILLVLVELPDFKERVLNMRKHILPVLKL